ncbi:MAG: PfkB family carbohydrate kinase [Lentisphaeria bacterium]|nr:PfkB family carbohydrate kinase [Lentisphaeria bacterium]
MGSTGQFDVLGFGYATVDELLFVDRYPAPDSKTAVHDRIVAVGGLTTAALIAASRLGGRCAYAGVLGPDADSRIILDVFDQEGIDRRHVRQLDHGRAVYASIIVDTSRKTRTILYDKSGAVELSSAMIDPDLVHSTRVLFVDHHGIDGMTCAAELARRAGIPVVADFERTGIPGLDALIALVDHLILPAHFAFELTDKTDPREAVMALLPGREAAVVTCGTDGGWYAGADTGGPVPYEAFVVDAVDTTGCGDVFHGAYAWALATGHDLSSRIRYAAAAAALKATTAGGHRAIPTGAAVEQLLR